MTDGSLTARAGDTVSRFTDRVPWWAGYAVVVAFLVASPFVFARPFLFLIAEVFIFAIFAIGYNVLQGYTGIVSFGHAMFFGIGAYATGKVLLETGSFSLAVLAALASVLALALVVGYLGIRRIGVYFAMITLAFNQLFYILAFKLEVVGGYDGLPGIPKPSPLGLDLSDPFLIFWFISAFLVVSYVVVKRIVHSPLGLSLLAIRENEERTSALGYHTRWIKILSLVISAFFAAIGGILFTTFRSFVSPEVIHFTQSGDVIFMVLLGGQGTLLGPIVGSFVLLLMRDILPSVWTRWPLLLGLLFVALSVNFRSGIMGYVRARLD